MLWLGHPWFGRQYWQSNLVYFLLVAPHWLCYLLWNKLALCGLQVLGALPILLVWQEPWRGPDTETKLDTSVHTFFPQLLLASHLHTAVHCKTTWVWRLGCL